MRLGAQPGRGDTAGSCTGPAEVGPGSGRPLGAGGGGRRALDAPGRSPRPARESGPWSGRGRRSDHVRPRELARGGGVRCARAHRGWGLGIPRLPSLGLNFPPRARQPPRDDPRVCSSSKLQRGRRREGVRGEAGSRPGTAAAQRRSRLRQPHPGLPRSLPVGGAAGRAGWRLRRTRAPGSGHRRGKFGFGELPERCRGGRARQGWQCPPSAHFGGHEGGLTGSGPCASGPTLPPLPFTFAATPGEGAVLSSWPGRALSSREDASRPRSRHR